MWADPIPQLSPLACLHGPTVRVLLPCPGVPGKRDKSLANPRGSLRIPINYGSAPPSERTQLRQPAFLERDYRPPVVEGLTVSFFSGLRAKSQGCLWGANKHVSSKCHSADYSNGGNVNQRWLMDEHLPRQRHPWGVG